MSETILECDNLSVRTVNGLERMRTAETNGLDLSEKARYRFRNFNSETVTLNKNVVPIVLQDDETLRSTKTECPALFFDQTSYTFSIYLKNAVTASVFSPLESLCCSADWDKSSEKLNVPVNFGNDLGDFEICWEWETADGERHTASFGSQVFSTKLDIYTHFKTMIDDVKEKFEWIKLDLLRQTTWGWSHDPSMDASSKTWLIIFQEVRTMMEERFVKLVEQHRRRLVSETKMLRAEQMRRISPRLEECVAEGLDENVHRRYRVEKHVLDADTPENRFMKYILFETLIQLNEVIGKIEPVKRIGTQFKNRLKEWADEWAVLKQHRFWRGIGEYRGLRQVSLILSQDPLYAGIRRSWYLLQQGMKFLDRDLRGGIQNAAQLYEVWCLVTIDALIIDSGWVNTNEKFFDIERADDDFDSGNEELRSGTVKFEYSRNDTVIPGAELILLFQPTAKLTPAVDGIWNGMTADPVEQRPDIVLRLHRKGKGQRPVFTWIFDAKYRLEKNNAPEEAVNQMHRYRDAILWAEKASGNRQALTRESIGAYVLYPGDEKEAKTSFPQIASVSRTNIGAFPLRPGKEKGTSETGYLKQFLETLINIKPEYTEYRQQQDEYYTSVPMVKTKDHALIARCRADGKSALILKRLFYLPADRITKLDPKRWHFLILQTEKNEECFHILAQITTGAEVIARCTEAGAARTSDGVKPDEQYWLFDLGEALSSIPVFTDSELCVQIDTED